MKRVLPVSLCILALAGCAADGTAVGTAPPATAVTPATATVSAVPATTGTIARAESVTPAVKQGGNAVIAVGASVLGALVPGPWGGVAGVAAGQAGRVALDNYDTRSVRYVVRMSDGSVRTVTQNDPLAMPVGTPVELVTLSNGAQRLVQTNVMVQ